MAGTLTLPRGLPGSGKTTWVWAQVAAAAERGEVLERVSRDDLRRCMISPGYGTPRSEVEDLITATEQAAARDALQRGWSVVVDATNLDPRFVEEWRRAVADLDVRVVVNDELLREPVDDCVRRDAARRGAERVGETVIRELHDRFAAAAAAPPATDAAD